MSEEIEIRVALFVVGCNEPTFTEIRRGLESLQALVGGYIEAVPLENYTEEGIGEGLILICNEEGKLEDLPVTRFVPGDQLVGSFLVVRQDGEEFSSITPEDERLLSQWKWGVKWGDFR